MFFKVDSQNESLKISRINNCNTVKCDLNLKCKLGQSLKYLNTTCCPTCVCDDCLVTPCPYGFISVKQEKTSNECCDTITCISDPNNNEDLTISILNNDENTIPQQNHHTFGSAVTSNSNKFIYQTLKPFNSFNPSQKDSSSSKEFQENEYSQESENFDGNESDMEIYVDNYQGKTKSEYF